MLYELDGVAVQAEGDYWVADSATVVGNVLLKQNASVWFNAVVRGDNDLQIVIAAHDGVKPHASILLKQHIAYHGCGIRHPIVSFRLHRNAI